MLHQDIHLLVKSRLQESLSPTHLEVKDVSSRHAGHSGARPEGQTHFEVTVISEKFEGLSRVQRHQLVYKLLEDYIGNPIHALAIQAECPKPTV